MKLGIRGKLFFVSLLLLVCGGFTSGTYLESTLQKWLHVDRQIELDHLARTVTIMVTPLITAGADQRQLDAWASAIHDATATDVRIELGATVPMPSQTSANDSDMLRATIPIVAGEHRGTVQIATPVYEIQQMMQRLRWMLWAGGLLGLCVALFMSVLASHMVSRALRQLIAQAVALARGGGDRIQVQSEDELEHLAGSVNRLADGLQQTMAVLARERDRFETILRGMSDAVIALDPRQQIILANPAAVALLGLQPDLWRAQRERGDAPTLLDVTRSPAINALVHKAHHAVLGADAAQGHGSGEHAAVVSGECELPGPGDRRVLVTITPLGRDGSTVLVLHDVTERRRLETVRRDFVANVSHELRTPVSVIRANAETLMDGALHDPVLAPRFMDGILRNAERLARLISELLDLSRIEAGHIRLVMHPIRVADAVSRAIGALEGRALERHTVIRVNVDARAQVYADAHALDQILFNLLDNGIKYTSRGGEIEISAVEVNDASGAPQQVRIMVQDNGPGMDVAIQARVFERFFRADESRSRDAGGAGLGLAIVKHLVEAMGGTVGVRNIEPCGSAFWFTLPAADDTLLSHERHMDVIKTP